MSLLVFMTLFFSYNSAILESVLMTSGLSLMVKLSLLGKILYGYMVEISIQKFLSLGIAVLSGMNATLISAYMAQHKAETVSFLTLMSGGSIASALLGVGCLSCGSLITAFIASIVGASSVLVILPFSGLEFSFISVGLLVFSIVIVYRKITRNKYYG